MAKDYKKDSTVKLTTPVFRLSFPNLFEARKASDDANSKPKFGCAAIWTPSKFTEKEKAQWSAILKQLDAESRRAFNKAWKELRDPYKKGLRSGAEKEGMEGYGPDTRFANLTTKNRPGVVDLRSGERIGPEHGNADEIYPGCYCRATVNVYSFGTKPGSKGKGVAIGLRNIQKIKDGPRLDNRVAAEDDFDEELDGAWLDQADDFSDDAATGEDGDEF